jgi:hypothetical protein
LLGNKLYSTNEALHKGSIFFLWGEWGQVLDFFGLRYSTYCEGLPTTKININNFMPLAISLGKKWQKTQVSKKFLVIDERRYMHLWGTSNFGHFVETNITL